MAAQEGRYSGKSKASHITSITGTQIPLSRGVGGGVRRPETGDALGLEHLESARKKAVFSGIFPAGTGGSVDRRRLCYNGVDSGAPSGAIIRSERGDAGETQKVDPDIAS